MLIQDLFKKKKRRRRRNLAVLIRRFAVRIFALRSRKYAREALPIMSSWVINDSSALCYSVDREHDNKEGTARNRACN